MIPLSEEPKSRHIDGIVRSSRSGMQWDPPGPIPAGARMSITDSDGRETWQVADYTDAWTPGRSRPPVPALRLVSLPRERAALALGRIETMAGPV